MSYFDRSHGLRAALGKDALSLRKRSHYQPETTDTPENILAPLKGLRQVLREKLIQVRERKKTSQDVQEENLFADFDRILSENFIAETEGMKIFRKRINTESVSSLDELWKLTDHYIYLTETHRASLRPEQKQQALAASLLAIATLYKEAFEHNPIAQNNEAHQDELLDRYWENVNDAADIAYANRLNLLDYIEDTFAKYKPKFS